MGNQNFKKRIVFLLIAGILPVFFFSAQAQNFSVKGNVLSSEDSQPLPGVNVVIKGKTQGTITDIDGNFNLATSKSDTLIFSFIGYLAEEVAVNGQANIDVTLVLDAESLSEVVVIGYGVQKKSHTTGAIASVGGEDLAAIQAVRVDDALAGKLSGVLIQNSSGEPGTDPKIQIRAASSVSGESSPLIVVDGFPISGSIATVNPNDIQSLEVLKDAASAAIYGSRGANGVILITTKSGKIGKPQFSYNNYFSTSKKYRDNISMTGGEWAEHIRSEVDAGNMDLSHLDAAFVEYRLTAYEESPDVVNVEDWLYKTGSVMSHDFSMSGASEDVSYFASIGYLDSEGTVRDQAFEKMNARVKVDAKLGDRFKTGLNFNGFVSDRSIAGWDIRDIARSYSVHPIYHTEASIAFVQELNDKAVALGLDPFDDGKNSGATEELGFNQSIYTLEPGDFVNDWHYGRSDNGIGGSGDQGPATKLDNTEQTQQTIFGNVTTYLQLEIFKGLNLKTVLGGDINSTEDFQYIGLESDAKGRGTSTTLDNTNLNKSSALSETTLSYANTFAGKHDVSAVAGLEFQSTYYNGIALEGTNVPNSDIINYNLLDPSDITVTERDETVARQSLFGRINYAFDNRYMLSASVRRDGDSRFGANNRFETFPAISLGWNVHNEGFFSAVEPVSRLKLRVSRGSLGTTSFLDAYSSLSLLNASTTIYGTGYLIPSDVENADLTWQTNTETNIGIDLGFMENRFQLSVDYFISDIQDMLISQSVSEVLGTPSVNLNTGDMSSSGIEIELNANIIKTSDFTWNIGANFTKISTEITDLGDLDELPREAVGQSGRDILFRNYVGGQIGEMWGLETTGTVEYEYLTDPTRHPNYQSGLYYVKDQQVAGEDGYGEIDNTRTVEEGGDLVKVGNNTPDFFWGLTSSMAYKGFDLSFQLQGSHGAEVYNVDPYYYGSQWGTSRMRMDIFDADGDGIADANGEFYKDAKGRTDANIQDASYVALRNLTIGYTLPTKWVSKIGLGSVRAYVAANNLFYIMADNYTSYNPEGIETTGDYSGPTTSGFQVGASPVVRTFTFGLNVNF